MGEAGIRALHLLHYAAPLSMPQCECAPIHGICRMAPSIHRGVLWACSATLGMLLLQVFAFSKQPAAHRTAAFVPGAPGSFITASSKSGALLPPPPPPLLLPPPLPPPPLPPPPPPPLLLLLLPPPLLLLLLLLPPPLLLLLLLLKSCQTYLAH
jgi:hypothetical protein